MLFRKQAFDKYMSPDQLDQAIKITSPLSWLALLGATLIVVITTIWSIIGRIPVTVTSPGIIAAPINTNAIYSEYSGTVTATYVTLGSDLHLGTKVFDITTPDGEVFSIFSDQVGSVSDLGVSTGDVVSQNSEVLRVSPVSYSNHVIVTYIPIADVKKIERGMLVNVALSAANSQSYGHMVARVINIDARASSNAGMSYVLGNDNNLINNLTSGNAVAAVTCELYPDSDTDNGYYWSNKNGGHLTISNGTLCSVKIITDEIPPISKLFSKVKELWNGK